MFFYDYDRREFRKVGVEYRWGRDVVFYFKFFVFRDVGGEGVVWVMLFYLVFFCLGVRIFF